MRGQVLEINCRPAERAMQILRNADLFLEVSLYGAQIHVVAEEVAEMKPQIKELLDEGGVAIQMMQVIAPSLEDVFIASVSQ